MTTIVVLGMHRSRTSLVSHMCSVLGVHMGKTMLGVHPSQPHGHWEDVEFYEFNKSILADLGGRWDHPISIQKIIANAGQFRYRARTLIGKRSSYALWGWKDPRTCITLPVYLPYLRNPVFIFTKRKKEDVIQSLIKRNRGDVAKWERVIPWYEKGIAWAKEQGVPSVIIDTDRLMKNRAWALLEVNRLAEFLFAPEHLVAKAIEVIDYGSA